MVAAFAVKCPHELDRLLRSLPGLFIMTSAAAFSFRELGRKLTKNFVNFLNNEDELFRSRARAGMRENVPGLLFSIVPKLLASGYLCKSSYRYNVDSNFNF